MRASAALRALSASPAVRFELGTKKAAPLLDAIVKQASGGADAQQSDDKGSETSSPMDLAHRSIVEDGSASDGQPDGED